MATYNPDAKLWTGPELPGVFNPEANLGQIFMNILSRSPSKVIQINADTGYEMTCAEMKLRSVRVALNLRKLGYRPGDLVTLACINTDNVVPVYVGCLTLGLVVNPLAPVFNKDDLAHMMRLTQSKVVFCDENNRAVVQEAAYEAIHVKPRVYVMGAGSKSALSVEDLLASVDGEDSFEAPYLGDSKTTMAAILCSSGTTGRPKGVCYSHSHLIEAEGFAETLNAGPIFSFSQLFWLTGVLSVHTSILCTRPRIITTQSFNADAFFSIIENYKVEDTFTPPACIEAIQNHPRYRKANFSSLKRWTIGGAPVTADILASLGKRFQGTDAKPIYGCSEVGLIVSSMLPFAMGSVGSVAKNTTVKIVDDSGRNLGPNERGEIRARFKHQFLGYLNNPQMTRDASDSEGFFKTGDVGYFDSNGFLYVVDRIKDIIKYMNFQISPSDLEEVILKIDGVKQVCVAGIPTADRSSDLPTAMVVLQLGSQLTEKEIVKAVDQQVGDYKRLRGGVYFVDRLPMSPAGKILRRVVREMLLEKSNFN
nr:4-coumarate--CoA ligase 1-like [Aedes albopictus]